MDNYIVDPLAIVHKASVDFMQRNIESVIHIVQYDDREPVLEVHLYLNGEVYNAPNNLSCYLRFTNSYGYSTRVAINGFNNDRSIAYVELTKNITSFIDRREWLTKGEAVIELSASNARVCSSKIHIHIDRNPVQE